MAVLIYNIIHSIDFTVCIMKAIKIICDPVEFTYLVKYKQRSAVVQYCSLLMNGFRPTQGVGVIEG